MSGHAYIDSSCVVAIALKQPHADHAATRIRSFTTISAHPLLDAEVRSACSREGAQIPEKELDRISWIGVPVPLSAEINRVLAAGYLRGADCFHIATALFLVRDPRQLTFLTLDLQQRAVAKKLGFRV